MNDIRTAERPGNGPLRLTFLVAAALFVGGCGAAALDRPDAAQDGPASGGQSGHGGSGATGGATGTGGRGGTGTGGVAGVGGGSAGKGGGSAGSGGLAGSGAAGAGGGAGRGGASGSGGAGGKTTGSGGAAGAGSGGTGGVAGSGGAAATGGAAGGCSGGCCQNSDCPGVCATCDTTTHSCVAAKGIDDPNGRCSGTCDASGACKSKRGQSCSTATATACITGSTCADGYCCDTACTGACMACDVSGSEGTCSAVSSGPPHGSRTCTAPAGGTASCSAGSCASSCGTMKLCAAANICVASGACCVDSDCPAMTNETAKCDATAHACTYACANGTTACNGACIPTGSTCTTLFALMTTSDGDQLIKFGASTPGTVASSTLITGVASGAFLTSMSYRPSTGVLYALGTDSQLYSLNTTTGVATPVGSPLSPVLESTPSFYVAMAFVPGSDVIRIWDATGQNLRASLTGGAATVDGRLPQGFGTGIAPRTIAFTSGGTLYALDALNDTLSKAVDATAGTVTQVGPLGINVEEGGLVILPSTTTAFALTELDNQNRDPRLYSVNLSTGALTSVGAFAGPSGAIRALVVSP